MRALVIEFCQDRIIAQGWDKGQFVTHYLMLDGTVVEIVG